MSLISRGVTLTGLILLAHACYSVQEHTALAATSTKPSSSHQHLSHSLPLDVCIETVAATLVVCLGLVLGSQKLRPIRWDVWAGKIEREGEYGDLGIEGEYFRGSPFGILEARPGFVDIRKQRRDFTEWAKHGGK